MTTCERCGVELQIGDFPYCPHGRQANSVIGDEIDETHEDLDPDGGVIRFRSRTEKQRYLDAHHLEPMVRWAGPHDQHVKRWATMDAYTLASAAALCDPARRTGTQGDRPKAVCDTATFAWWRPSA